MTPYFIAKTAQANSGHCKTPEEAIKWAEQQMKASPKLTEQIAICKVVAVVKRADQPCEVEFYHDAPVVEAPLAPIHKDVPAESKDLEMARTINRAFSA